MAKEKKYFVHQVETTNDKEQNQKKGSIKMQTTITFFGWFAFTAAIAVIIVADAINTQPLANVICHVGHCVRLTRQVWERKE